MAGEDLDFIENYMAKETQPSLTAPLEDLFKGDQLLDDVVSLPAGRKLNY